MTVENKVKLNKIKTLNLNIIDHVIKYAEEVELSLTIMSLINHMRIYKRIYLSCKLGRMNRESKTYELYGKESTSSFK